ncbi:MAG: hypothetical protein VX527_12310 [Planctomycetota bacterium]|nr:hypothetical protein [Planctomycetota bacterium]
MRMNRVLLTLILGATSTSALSSMALAQESIYELRPPSGVVGTSSTAGMEALVLQISNLELLQVDLVPVLDGTLFIVDNAEEIEAARSLVQDYMEASAYMLVTAALQLGGTEDSPPSVAPLTTIMLGQIGYVMAITAPLDEDPELLYRSIALDPRFPDLLPEVQVAMIGRYVQELLLRSNRTTEETSVLAVVDNKAFMTALSELSEVVTGITDIYEIDWKTLEDETILIRYYDERLLLVERTVTGIEYDHRYGVSLPPEDEQDAIVRVNLSRIEVVQVSEDSTTN